MRGLVAILYGSFSSYYFLWGGETTWWYAADIISTLVIICLSLYIFTGTMKRPKAIEMLLIRVCFGSVFVRMVYTLIAAHETITGNKHNVEVLTTLFKYSNGALFAIGVLYAVYLYLCQKRNIL
jgi:hypothetical protein